MASLIPPGQRARPHPAHHPNQDILRMLMAMSQQPTNSMSGQRPVGGMPRNMGGSANRPIPQAPAGPAGNRARGRIAQAGQTLDPGQRRRLRPPTASNPANRGKSVRGSKNENKFRLPTNPLKNMGNSTDDPMLEIIKALIANYTKSGK
jgi:hypothetical protein